MSNAHSTGMVIFNIKTGEERPATREHLAAWDKVKGNRRIILVDGAPHFVTRAWS